MESSIAWIDDIRMLTVNLDDNVNVLQSQEQPIIYWLTEEKFIHTKIEQWVDKHTVKIRFFEDIPLGENLRLLWAQESIPIYPRDIVRNPWFDEQYATDDVILGATCSLHATTFSLWAPTAISVTLYLNNKKEILSRQNRGVWSTTIYGDYHGYSYEYELNINGTLVRVNDPYAKALLPNSEKGVVVDFSRLNNLVKNPDRPYVKNLQDSIIYELHVRDATIQKESGVINRGKFLGLTEFQTKTTNGASTGITYIKELGCTHVQLLPINDFARINELQPLETYNWGYDPLFFQVPEGSYSVSPNDPFSRIMECKKMINSFHEADLSVILDVVYNHVFIMEDSPFEKIVPGYYFRYHSDGSLSNGTGVGNDLATERKMVRKFILDTIDFWLTEYHVDGFRFDLMGAMDIETINDIQQRCERESPPIMLLGEGWDLPTALPSDKKATSANSVKLNGIRFFNDYFRDTLKGNLFEVSDVGYINGKGRYIERLNFLVSGSVLEEYGEPFVTEVNQTINYVECHDNHTLWDRLLITNSQEREIVRKKMHQLATGLVLLSQGVPFIHAGQEWYRTKNGVENSYISNDEINKLDWRKRELEKENIEFIKKLISIRKKYPVFRLTNKQDIRKRYYPLQTPQPVFGYALIGDCEDIAVYANPTNESYKIQLPSAGTWEVSASNSHDKQKAITKGEFTIISPFELIVYKKARY